MTQRQATIAGLVVLGLCGAGAAQAQYYYGPRDYALLELFKAIGRGMMPMIGRYDKQVSLVHARDLANGIILAGESERSTGRAYFISSDEVYSMRRLAASIAEIRPCVSPSTPRSIAAL